MRELFNRLRFLVLRSSMDRDLAEEVQGHLQRKAEENRAAGMSDEEAHYTAQRQLGNLALQQEQSRSSWGFPLLESIFQDVVYGLRGLRKSPGFSAVAILTLALGIGATTAIFNIVNAILLRPLPFKDSERVVQIWTISSQFGDFPLGESKPDFEDIKSQAPSFETMALCEPLGMNLTNPGEPEQVMGVVSGPDLLAMFGVQPQLGRDLQPDDEPASKGNVALISYGLWQRKFGGDSGILGRKLTLDQKVYTVVGVLPRGFEFPNDVMTATGVLIPLSVGNMPVLQNRGAHFLSVFAKLKPGTKLQTAQAELDGIAARLSNQYPEEDSGITLRAVLLREEVIEAAKSKLLVLLGAVGFLLMIACANVGNLILSRGVQRQREIAVRAALGAGRGRIVRQLLIESLLLACAGGAAGLLIAVAGVESFRAFAPRDVPRLSQLRLEPAIAWIGLLISSLAGILCGLAPALHSSRSDLVFALKDRTATSEAQGSRRFSLRSFLVVSEVALALVLLAGSALLAQSLVRMLRVDPGFRTDHLLTAWLNSAAPRYSSDEARQAFLRNMMDEFHAHPELSRAAMSTYLSMNGTVMQVLFDPATLGLAEKPVGLESKSVDPGYFETMGIPLLYGRTFTEHDTPATTPVIIINEAFARHYLSGQNPLGKTLQLGFGPKGSQIIGVVADIRDVHIKERPRPQFYSSLLQHLPLASMTVYIRTKSDDPMQLAPALRRSVQAVDKDMHVTEIQSMAAVISQSVAEPRFRTWLLSAFAGAGLALTLIGIYGVISYSVNRRTHEMGIRIALGAQAADVLWLVLQQGIRLAVLGAAIGLLGSLALMRLLASQLYDIKPHDPVTLAGAVLLMLVVAWCASYIPARRATKVDPMVALRHE
jgi:putative ABC transport system permease protein